MNKNLQTVIFIIIILIVTGFLYIKIKKENDLLGSIEKKMIYFYGAGCPHCAKVETFFQENNVEDKIQFEKREVYNDRGNAKLLILVAKRKCNLKDGEIGVPFLWDGLKCLVGDQPIINYFKEKIAL